MSSFSSDQVGMLAPLSTPLPEPPGDEAFTPEQWTTLLAIMDTVIPSIRRETTSDKKNSTLTVSDVQYNKVVDHLKKSMVNAPTTNLLDEYFDERPSESARFQDLLRRTLVHYSRDDARNGLAFVLSALNTRVGSLMLTGSATCFSQQPIRVRESILEKWRLSYIPPLNDLYKQMTFVSKCLWLRTSPLFQKLSGYPKVPNHYQPGPSFEYQFLQFPSGQSPEVIETDVVIVGSGCGGGVCAKNLAEAGHRVIVVDKSYYYPPSQLPMSEDEGSVHLFDNGGVTVTDDGSVPVIAGSCWGGGGTVNWSASLQPQNYVRKEWAQDRGLPFFETAEFQTCLDRVCHRMGVSADHIRHNHGNQVLLEGSRKLGYTAKAVPQNTGGKEHYCGQCSMGCGAAQKQGPVVSWLPDAAKSGAQFIEGFKVDHVVFDESSGTKKAIGVKGTWTSRNSRGGVDGPLSERVVREIFVKAKKVIVSCGTLWSPVVLLKSGLKNRQIGRNLYLHPVNIVAGVFKEDIRPWEGGILTTVCSSFENLDGHGHGVKLEACTMLPGMFLTLMNWDSGLSFKTQVLKFRHTNGYISIARDRDTGRVYVDGPTGLPRLDYSPSAFDRAHIMEGVIALAKILYVEAATEIHVGLTGVKPFIRDPDVAEVSSPSHAVASALGDIDPGVTDKRFEAWLAEVRRIGNKPPVGTFACAHQMGSNRMSAREKDGVVDPRGRVWGTKGLYVADASVFPSASGVNPMITNMAISDWISRGVSKDLRSAGVTEARL